MPSTLISGFPSLSPTRETLRNRLGLRIISILVANSPKLEKPKPANLLPFALVSLLVLMVYWSTLTAEPFLYSDDYTWLSEPVPMVGMFVAIGRPLTGLFLAAGHELYAITGSLALLRLPGVVGLIALALLTLHWLLRHGVPKWHATSLAVLLTVLPSSLLSGVWFNTATSPWAACFAGLAAMSASQVCKWNWTSLANAICSCWLLQLALMTYQPAAMYFWVFAFIAVTANGIDMYRKCNAAKPMSALCAYYVIGLTGIAIYAFLYKRVMLPFYGLSADSRTEMLNSPLAKLNWFANEVFVNAANGWLVHPSRAVAAVVGGLLVIGFAIGLKRFWQSESDYRFGRTALFSLLMVGLFPLAYFPNLAVNENWASYRSMFAFAPLLLFAGYFALVVVLDGVQLPGRQTLLAGLMTMALCSGLYHGATTAGLYAHHRAEELKMITYSVQMAIINKQHHIHIIQPTWFQGPGGDLDLRYDEFGIASAYHPWAPPRMVNFALDMLGKNPKDYTVTFSPDPANVPAIDNLAVIDMRAMLPRVRLSLWRKQYQ